MLTYNIEEAENLSEKDLSLISYTLVDIFLEHFPEESVVPQKVLVCIASNACHF